MLFSKSFLVSLLLVAVAAPQMLLSDGFFLCGWLEILFSKYFRISVTFFGVLLPFEFSPFEMFFPGLIFVVFLIEFFNFDADLLVSDLEGGFGLLLDFTGVLWLIFCFFLSLFLVLMASFFRGTDKFSFFFFYLLEHFNN